MTEGEIVVVDRGMKTLLEFSNEKITEHLKNRKSVTIHRQS